MADTGKLVVEVFLALVEPVALELVSWSRLHVLSWLSKSCRI